MSDFLRKFIGSHARKYAKAILNPLLGMFRPGNVAMFHVGRVGSTVLAGMLQQHRRVYWPGEVFEKEHARYMRAVRGRNVPDSYVLPKDPLKILRIEMRQARNRMFGFETKFLEEHHLKVIGLDLGRYVQTLSDLGFDRFIVLRRKNILRRLVSGVVLRDTGVSHLRAGEDLKSRSFNLDLYRIPLGARYFNLVDAIQMIECAHEDLERVLSGKKVCELTYEEHISTSPVVAYREVMSFLELEPGEPHVLLRKTNPGSLSDMIENYNELEAMLEKTPYRWMLESA
jgi:hypothetical protein